MPQSLCQSRQPPSVPGDSQSCATTPRSGWGRQCGSQSDACSMRRGRRVLAAPQTYSVAGNCDGGRAVLMCHGNTGAVPSPDGLLLVSDGGRKKAREVMDRYYAASPCTDALRPRRPAAACGFHTRAEGAGVGGLLGNRGSSCDEYLPQSAVSRRRVGYTGGGSATPRNGSYDVTPCKSRRHFQCNGVGASLGLRQDTGAAVQVAAASRQALSRSARMRGRAEASLRGNSAPPGLRKQSIRTDIGPQPSLRGAAVRNAASSTFSAFQMEQSLRDERESRLRAVSSSAATVERRGIRAQQLSGSNAAKLVSGVHASRPEAEVSAKVGSTAWW
eukprot:TRINITY_DN4528_c2_g1_i1.p1 TRINITY_DN4528_c2_g1~~TRINITY_DN4528_c2_g1_i1.p1  ORF type:complete len:349 (+),score=23.67 TRINITY_DN4528_c2_g1_i1:55-1047(+)